MIKTAIRLQDDMVFVFDKNGEQICEYQGQYEEVKESILSDASPDTVFYRVLTNVLKPVNRQQW